MKRLTSDFLNKVMDNAILEYTRNRFISEDEIDDLKKCFSAAFDERIERETADESMLVLTVNNL